MAKYHAKFFYRLGIPADELARILANFRIPWPGSLTQSQKCEICKRAVDKVKAELPKRPIMVSAASQAMMGGKYGLERRYQTVKRCKEAVFDIIASEFPSDGKARYQYDDLRCRPLHR